MAIYEGTRALNELLQILEGEHFSADVEVNGVPLGREEGRIDLTDPRSRGKIQMETMDDNKFYTGFDVGYQNIQYDTDMNSMSIIGSGTKGCMNGEYKVIFSNIK